MSPIIYRQDVDAGWKFWKKKKEDDTSEDPALASALSTTTAKSAAAPTTPNPKLLGTPVIAPVNPKSGVAAAADPALAIGVGNTAGKIREDARGPHKPNPGTEVGLDVGLPKPQKPGVGPGGSGYRDWAAEFTGAGDPSRRGSKLPEKGFDGFEPNQGRLT